MTGGDDAGPSWLNAQSNGGGSDEKPIDTDGWFDSNLPPAASMPEAANLRASDDDPDSQEASSGIPGGDAPNVAEILRRRVPTADDPPQPPPPPPAQEFPREPPAPQPPGYQYPQPPPYQGPPKH
jgi:hypothetical protein